MPSLKGLKKAMEQLENISVTDEMTGVFNRRFAYQVLARQMDISKKEKRGFVICFIDIDNLKTVNDTYGHAAGDQVLRQLGQHCHNRLRDSDFLGRIGGEEFALLLPDTPQDSAFHVAERMREQLSKTSIALDNGITLEITASFGVASVNEEGADFNAMLHRADAAMYNAKHGGRNQVKSAA